VRSRLRRHLAVVALGALGVSFAGCTSGPKVVGTDATKMKIRADAPFELEEDRCWREVPLRTRIGEITRQVEAMDGVQEVAAEPSGTDRDVGLEVFLEVDGGPSVRQAVERLLADLPDVGSRHVTYVSQAEQYRLFREYFRDEPEYLNNVHKEDLPASLRVDVATRVDSIVIRDGGSFRSAERGRTTLTLESRCGGTSEVRVVQIEVV
jgi:hypothetical protein